MGLSTKVSDHIRSNVWGIAAMFVALTGSAYAMDGPLPGQNQVGSADIINGEVLDQDIGAGQVKNAQIAANAIGSGKVADGSLTGTDLAPDAISDDTLNPLTGSTRIAANAVKESELGDSSVFSSEVAPNSLTGDDIATNSVAGGDIADQSIGSADLGPGSVGSSEVASDSLGGGDINESTLSALDGHDSFDPLCDPSTETDVTCDELTFTLGRRMQVLTTFDYGFGSGSSDEPVGACRTTLDGAYSSNYIYLFAPGMSFSDLGGIPVVDVLTLDAGDHTIGLRCAEAVPDSSDIEIRDIRIAAVELGMD
jgi:hypothetical protein